MMFPFEKISVNQIMVFSEILNTTSLLQIEFMKQRYEESALHFEDTLQFLQELGLIKKKDDRIIVAPKFRTFLSVLATSKLQQQTIRDFLIYHLLTNTTLLSKYVKEFLSHFHSVSGQYKFTPMAAQRLKYSGLRNFLIDLELLYLDLNNKKYVISDIYLSILQEQKESQQLSSDEFFKIMERKTEIGKAAELEVIKYERQRLHKIPFLVGEIEHTGLKDVMAGYDIKSFEDNLDEDNHLVPRYIEVKAVSPWKYTFQWTRNEIEKAKFYKQSYYLYLLPVRGKNKFDLTALKIIRDPYLHIYKDGNGWICTEEILAFSLSG